MNARLALLPFLYAGLQGVALAAEAPGDEVSHRPPGSVYAVDPLWDSIVTVVAGGGALTAYFLAPEIVNERCPCDPQEVNSFDRRVVGYQSGVAENLSQVTLAASIATPVAIELLGNHPAQVLFEDALVMAQTLALNGAATVATQLSVQRPTPIAYAGTTPAVWHDGHNYDSFFSGHTSTTFAALGMASMTIGYRYDQWVMPWVFTLLVGSSVAVQRVLAGEHFITDVIVGAAVGTAFGIAVPWFHHRRARSAGLQLAASVSSTEGRLLLVGRF